FFSSRRRHTRCYRDWSSDVCSSDLDSEFSAKINLEDSFVERVFVETIEHFENNTSWKYRGDTPLILCRGYLLYHKQTRKPRAFRSEERRVGKEDRIQGTRYQ